MKIRKNLEAVFLVAAAMAISATYATAKVPAFHQAKAAPAAPAAPAAAVTTMHVVVVKGQRLSAAEKAALN